MGKNRRRWVVAGNSRRPRGDYRGMDCENYRLGISARLDGEDAGGDAAPVACRAITTGVDLARGTATLLNESAHLLDLMGLASVWELARVDGPPRPERGPSRLSPVS